MTRKKETLQKKPIHESGEDYLEKILMLQERGCDVRSIDLAAEFGYSRPAISKAVKILAEDGFLYVDENGYLTLTESGMKRAEKIYDRHKSLTEFFELIGVDPKIAELDACKIEHDIHEETFQAIERLADRLKK